MEKLQYQYRLPILIQEAIYAYFSYLYTDDMT